VRSHLRTNRFSIGDYVLIGGEIRRWFADSTRSPGCCPGPWRRTRRAGIRSPTGTLDHPQYTRPADFRGHKVPEVLLSGNHARIEAWRKEMALERTAQ